MVVYVHALQGSPNDGGCALPCNVHALQLQFEAVRPSWLKPDVHKSPEGLPSPAFACRERIDRFFRPCG